MFPFRVLNQEVIEEILDMSSVIEVVEQAYTLKSTDQATLFPMIFHEFEQGKADMDIKSGHLSGANVFGLKLVSWFGENDAKGLPPLIGMVMVLDSRTGVPLGILSGEYITCMRTGAAGGIGAKYLARKNSEHLLIVGSGHQAPFQIMATLSTMENIKKVTVYNPNSYERAVNFCQDIKAKLINKFVTKYQQADEYYRKMLERCDIEFVATDNIEAAVNSSDIIITATPSRKPLIKQGWVKPGTHITCIGADMEGGKRERNRNHCRLVKGGKNMIVKPFKVEEWMNAYEHEAVYNIAETCVDSLTVKELISLSEEPDQFFRSLYDKKLTYGHIEGSPEFRQHIADLYKTMKPENILAMNGAIGANFLVFYTLVKPGDEVISVHPTYQQIYSVPESFGRK